MKDAAFRSIQRACYAGLDSVSLRREVAQRAGEALGFDAHVFSTHDPDTGFYTHLFGAGVPAGLGERVLQEHYPLETAAIIADRVQRGEYVFSLGEASVGFGELLRTAGLRHEMQAVAARSGSIWGSWCVMHERLGSGVEQRQRAFLTRLLPHLLRGFQTAALVDCARCATDTQDPAAPGILMVDERGQVVVRTAAAATVCQDLADVGLQGDPTGLPFVVAGAVAAVRQRLRAGPPEQPTTCSLRARGISGRWYSVRALLSEPDAADRCSTVVVLQPLAPREMAPILARLYGLSARECEVVAGVARGESTKRLASRLRVSPYTVQEHLKRATEKVGVRGRRALVARLFFDGYLPRLADRSTAVGTAS